MFFLKMHNLDSKMMKIENLNLSFDLRIAIYASN